VFRAESAYDESLMDYRQNADRIMFAMNIFLTMVCLAIAPYRNTWAASILIGVPTLALSYVLMREFSGALMTRLFMASAFMAYTSLIIHQTGGDIEAHFTAFGLIGVLLYYRDWRTIVVATVFIYLQHLVGGYAQTLGVPVYVFDNPEFWTVFPLHVAYFLPFVGMMGFLSIWLRREGHEQNRIIHESLLREDQLREVMVKAEVANRLKSEILANMSHEIRTPLNGVGGMIQLALDTPMTASQRELLRTAHESSEHLLNVLNNILDFSKIESGALEVECVAFDVRDLVESLQRFFNPLAVQKNINLEVSFESKDSLWLRIDPIRLRQVLMNLIGNAIKFTHSGGVFVRVQTLPTSRPDWVDLHFHVQDTGIGFAADQVETLFSPFVQADSSSTRLYGGTGLGLAITRSLVQCMGGKIQASSAAGLGAFFSVVLPCQIPLRINPLNANTPFIKNPNDDKYLDVLLVEDHPVNQKVMTLMLERMGHRVTIAENGSVGLECLAQNSFDLILLDVMMPVMDGPQMLKKLRLNEERQVAKSIVIMVTAHAMTGDAEKFLALGADGYLSKPVSIQTLEAEIARVLNVTQMQVRQVSTL